MIHQEDYENLVQLFKDTADSGRKNIFEVRVITLDNGFFWAAGIVERTLDENGNPVLISAFMISRTKSWQRRQRSGRSFRNALPWWELYPMPTR